MPNHVPDHACAAQVEMPLRISSGNPYKLDESILKSVHLGSGLRHAHSPSAEQHHNLQQFFR